MASKRSVCSARTSSGSSRSLSEVKPERSANRTVARRRSASALTATGCGAAAGGAVSEGAAPGAIEPFADAASFVDAAGSALPQRGQNENPDWQGAPQEGQAASSLLPHFGQKENSAGASKLQPRHCMATMILISQPRRHAHRIRPSAEHARPNVRFRSAERRILGRVLRVRPGHNERQRRLASDRRTPGRLRSRARKCDDTCGTFRGLPR